LNAIRSGWRRHVLCVAAVVVAFVGASSSADRVADLSLPPDPTSGTPSPLVSLPLAFEPNVGQTNRQADFMAKGPGYGIFLSGGDALLSLRRQGAGHAVRLHLVGADASASGTPIDRLDSYSNYLHGRDRRKWLRNVPTYGAVRYSGIYPGIDVKYYGNERRLEYDFELAAGAAPQQIRVAVEGIAGLRLDRRPSRAGFRCARDVPAGWRQTTHHQESLPAPR
jgi:hypothetical protein